MVAIYSLYGLFLPFVCSLLHWEWSLKKPVLEILSMTRIWRRILVSNLVLVALYPISCLPQTDSSLRPKIGFILSGGGSRGAALVGDIKLLDELRISIDSIAGTSMGAIVAILYASAELRNHTWSRVYRPPLYKTLMQPQI